MLENNDFLGTGLKFPVGINKVTGRFKMSSDDEDIKESIYIILMTRKGERLLMPNFGSNINDFVFEVVNETNLTLMENSIKNSIKKKKKRIRNLNVEISQDSQDSGRLIINISYIISNINMPGNIVFPFYIQEGVEGINE